MIELKHLAAHRSHFIKILFSTNILEQR